MKTRMELWKDYRSEIEKNVELKKAVQHSNVKLGVLYKRLLKVFPEYEEKYKNQSETMKVSLESIESTPEYSTTELDRILNEINIAEESFGGSLSEMDSLNFSSEELDSVIKEIKKGKIKSTDYIYRDNTDEVLIDPAKYVQLGGPVNKINVAIDGPSGSGKSTAARIVAQKYGFTYINTGLVYRAIALYMLKNKIETSDNEKVIEQLNKITIDLLPEEVVLLNGEDVTKAVRADDVSQNASIISVIPEVRSWALKIQQDKALEKGVVMDGRDTTFKVLPNAELKIFLDTKPEIRAQRRVDQNKRLGFSSNYEEILAEIKERDHRDRTRSTDPLHKTEDAILLDSSEMNLEEVVKKICSLIDELS